MAKHSGHALAGQALVSDQAATRLAATRFDPSCEVETEPDELTMAMFDAQDQMIGQLRGINTHCSDALAKARSENTVLRRLVERGRRCVPDAYKTWHAHAEAALTQTADQ